MTERPENCYSQWPSCRISLRTDIENKRYTNTGIFLSHKKCWYMSFRKHEVGLETMIRPMRKTQEDKQCASFSYAIWILNQS